MPFYNDRRVEVVEHIFSGDREPTLVPLSDEMGGLQIVDDGAVTRAYSPLERVIKRGETPRPGGTQRTPPSPKKD